MIFIILNVIIIDIIPVLPVSQQVRLSEHISQFLPLGLRKFVSPFTDLKRSDRRVTQRAHHQVDLVSMHVSQVVVLNFARLPRSCFELDLVDDFLANGVQLG